MTTEGRRWQVGLPPDLDRADRARYAAMLNDDVVALDQLLADDLVYTHSDGSSDDKAHYLASIHNGTLQYQRCERKPVHFMPLGDQALVRGSLRLEALYLTRQVSIHIHYLAVWVRHGGQPWQLLAWASTRLGT